MSVLHPVWHPSMLFKKYLQQYVFNIGGRDIVSWYSGSLVCLCLLLCDLNMQPCMSQRETNIGGGVGGAVNNTSSFSLSVQDTISPSIPLWTDDFWSKVDRLCLRETASEQNWSVKLTNFRSNLPKINALWSFNWLENQVEAFKDSLTSFGWIRGLAEFTCALFAVQQQLQLSF